MLSVPYIIMSYKACFPFEPLVFPENYLIHLFLELPALMLFLMTTRLNLSLRHRISVLVCWRTNKASC